MNNLKIEIGKGKKSKKDKKKFGKPSKIKKAKEEEKKEDNEKNLGELLVSKKTIGFKLDAF